VKKKFLYVTGDSFCAYRNNVEQHWPAKLASLLGLEIQGAGYPGQGWWPSRCDFTDYTLSDAFQHTEVFVFCHTDIHRPLTSNNIWQHGFTQQMVDFHTKHVLDYKVNLWTGGKWYKEIAQQLLGKNVVHLHCFNSNKTLRHLLGGLDIKTELVKLSRFNHSNNSDKMNYSANHLTDLGNLVLANMLYNSVVQGSDQVSSKQFEKLVYK
jgi:hypothetical protein